MRIKLWILTAAVICLLGIIARDFHIRELQQAANEGYRQGYQTGLAYGKASCPLPRA